MRTAEVVVSGRMAILFDKVALEVREAEEGAVDGYRCRWCGWTYVVDDPKLIPDHACARPVPASPPGPRG